MDRGGPLDCCSISIELERDNLQQTVGPPTAISVYRCADARLLAAVHLEGEVV